MSRDLPERAQFIIYLKTATMPLVNCQDGSLELTTDALNKIAYFRKRLNAGEDIDCRTLDKDTLQAMGRFVELSSDDQKGQDQLFASVEDQKLLKLISAAVRFDLREMMNCCGRRFSHVVQSAPASETAKILNLEPDFTEDEAEMMQAGHEWIVA